MGDEDRAADHHAGASEPRRGPIGRRALFALVAAPVLALVVGLLTMGADGATTRASAPLQAAGDGCAEHALRFPVTDDPDELARQQTFERTGAAITASGFYERATPATATLHAASHGSVVVFYRVGLPAAQLRGLRALAADSRSARAAVIVTPRRQAQAVTAVSLGRQLDCSAADAAQTRRVRSFAAAVYPSLKP